MNERIEQLEKLIPKLKTNKKILPLKIECMEWELRALKAEELVNKYSVINDVVGRSEQLNCDHEWRVDTFDCYGFPTEQYCDKCDKKQAI